MRCAAGDCVLIIVRLIDSVCFPSADDVVYNRARDVHYFEALCARDCQYVKTIQ